MCKRIVFVLFFVVLVAACGSKNHSGTEKDTVASSFKAESGAISTLEIQVRLPKDSRKRSTARVLKDDIAKIAGFLRKDSTSTVSVTAHTSDEGSAPSNMRLSQKRALEIKRYIASRCNVPASRIQAQGYGERQPAFSNRTSTGRRKNERVEIVLVSQLAQAPASDSTKLVQAQGREQQVTREQKKELLKAEIQKRAEALKKKYTFRFSTGFSDFSKELNDQIAALAAYLKKHPYVKAMVEGHTDSRGKFDTNLLLSQQRALSIEIALITHYGIDPDRIVTTGYGESKPIADNSSLKGRSLNRRVEVVLLPYDQPKGLAGKPTNNTKISDAKNVTYTPLRHAKGKKYRIEISISKCTLWLYEILADGTKKLVRPYKVATAKKGTPWPKGVGYVTEIDFDPWWYPTANMKRKAARRGKRLVPVAPGRRGNPMGAFKIHLSHGNGGGAYRIHGTNKPHQIGRRVSLGCVRMHNKEGKELAKAISVGTAVDIQY